MLILVVFVFRWRTWSCAVAFVWLVVLCPVDSVSPGYFGSVLSGGGGILTFSPSRCRIALPVAWLLRDFGGFIGFGRVFWSWEGDYECLAL